MDYLLVKLVCCARCLIQSQRRSRLGAPVVYAISLSLPRKGPDYESHLKLLL